MNDDDQGARMISGLQITGLRKSYGTKVALAELNLVVQPGQWVALVGPNGAGKTTALGMLAGELVPDGGQACVDGHDVFEAPLLARRLVGYVSQNQLLPGYLTVCEMVEFVCAVKTMAVDAPRLQRLLELTALADDRDRLIGELSHGMQRKAAWVAALIARPRVLLADEGLAGLDAQSSAAIVEQVAAMGKQGLAVLWTEHDLDLLVPYLDRAVLLRNGRVAETVAGDSLRADAAAGKLKQRMREWTAVAVGDQEG